MRPSQAFATPPTSTLDDARRWMRLGLAALASAVALSVLFASPAHGQGMPRAPRVTGTSP